MRTTDSDYISPLLAYTQIQRSHTMFVIYASFILPLVFSKRKLMINYRSVAIGYPILLCSFKGEFSTDSSKNTMNVLWSFSYEYFKKYIFMAYTYLTIQFTVP